MAQACPPVLGQLILSHISLGATIGVSYLGVAISAIMYGVTCCQTFYYFRSEKTRSDAWFLKTLVTVLMVVSTAQEGLIMHSVYHYVIVHFDDPCNLVGKIVWSIPAEVLLNSIMSFGVEGFLVFRIWKLGRNIYVTIFCAVLVVVESILTIIYPARVLAYPGPILAALDKFRALGVGSLSFAMVGDSTIAATLTFYLWRSRTGFRKSDGLITRLIVLTVSTGALTSAVVAADMLAYVISPNELYVLFFNYPIGKMYLNVLLTTLNIRGTLATPPGQSTTKGINSIPLTNIGAQRSPDARMDVKVDRVIEVGQYVGGKPRAEFHESIVLSTSMGDSSDGADGEV